MQKINMDSCVHFNHSEKEDPDSIRIICPYCYHETWFSFNNKELNRCDQCTIIINEEDINKCTARR